VEKSLKGGDSGLSASEMITSGDGNADNFQFESVSHTLPADSSLAELMDLVVLKLLNDDATMLSKNDKLQQLTILDLSYNPVKNISNICRINTDITGPKSKTLQSMNWYPSGKICFLPLPSTTTTITSSTPSIIDMEKGDELMLQKFLTWQSRNVVKDEDFAYNDPNIIQYQHQHNSEKKAHDDMGVQWTGVGADSSATQQRMKPSEIFTAVSTRSDNDNDHDIHKKKPPAKKKRSEKQRSQRLDTLIQNLTAKSSSSSKDGGGKKKRVSDKVRTMLIKSRAEGNKKLRMEDRFHLELLQLIDNGEENDDDIKSSDKTTTATSYKFFSRVTTAGRVASSVAGTIGNRKSVEFLVAFPPESTKDDTTNSKYRRLPNTMPLHDAQQAGWLQEFDVVVIRIFSIDRDDEFGQSKSVLDAESDVDSENNDEVDDDVVMQIIESPSESSCAPMNKDTSNFEADEQDDDNRLQQRLHLIYQTTSFDDKQKSTKKKKPVSKQVQAMLMKSKSTGNKGIKPNDRVHFETVIYRDDGSEDIQGACSSSFRFFSKRISVDELISTFQNEKDLQNVEIITSQSCSSSSLGCIYKKLTPSQATIEETVKLGFLEDFGRIIVRSTLSDSTEKLSYA
jgi:hypothetical protein